MRQQKLPAYVAKMIRQHKATAEEFDRTKRLIRSKGFRYMDPDERVLIVRQMNLLKGMVEVLDERLLIARTKG